MTKRKQSYPSSKPTQRSAPSFGGDNDRVTSINLSALTPKSSFQVGDRVRIGSGMYAGEVAIVESVTGGVIPAAMVRTESGHARRARAIDLVVESAERDRA